MKILKPGKKLYPETEAEREKRMANTVYQCSCPNCDSELEFLGKDVHQGTWYKGENSAFIICDNCHKMIILPEPIDYYVVVKGTTIPDFDI